MKVVADMNYHTKRTGYIAILIILVVAVVGAAAYVISQGPKMPNSNGGAVANAGGSVDGKISITDINDGTMTVPYYDIPLSQYSMDKFTETSGSVSYGDSSELGINVRSKEEDGVDWASVDWNAVKESGVDFVMIRVGYRDVETGAIFPDDNFSANIQGASGAGLKVGVYYYSSAISTNEAEEEANYVLSQIKSYSITYPVAFYWEFTLDDRYKDTARTKVCTATDITNITETFCKKIKMNNYTAAFVTNKTMGYEYFNLDTLKDYDIWYMEYKSRPAFYYDFQMWQYTAQGTVPTIGSDVRMTLSLKKYGN